MAARAPSQQDRDKNLDDLKQAVDEWGKKEKTRLENENKFMRAVLKGRTGSETTGTLNLANIADLLKSEIDAFISVGGDDKRV